MSYQKQPLKERIENYLYEWKIRDAKRWFPAGEIENMAQSAGYMGSSATRQLRKSVEEGILEDRKQGKSKVYRYNW